MGFTVRAAWREVFVLNVDRVCKEQGRGQTLEKDENDRGDFG